jgi:transcriptional regulator with XRE-family HTH domain
LYLYVKVVLIIIFDLSMSFVIAENIRYLRKLKRLSQLELGDLLEVTQASQSAYEREKAVPPVEYLSNLCKMYDICLDNFVHKELRGMNESEWNLYGIINQQDTITEVGGFKAIISEKDKRIHHLENTNLLLQKLVETSEPSVKISELEHKTEAIEQHINIILQALTKAKLLKNLEGLEELIADLERVKLTKKDK